VNVVDAPLEWVRVCRDAPYFETERGDAWTPVGHNDALSWPTLAPLSRDPAAVECYVEMLRQRGVTCLRLMLEYVQTNGRFFERPAGEFNPRVVRMWDRLFARAERHRIRLLLTPFDTFWMWKRWRHHPYNRANGGPADDCRILLTCASTRAAVKARFAFAIDRWGGSGALFAWDLWNEIHPAYADDDPGAFHDFIADVAAFVRRRESERYGRAHPITVSAFGPMLSQGFWSRELGRTAPDDRTADATFRHPALDFATVHTYATGTIDDPADTVAPALAMGELTRAAIAQIADGRPYFDSEHGPIHTFKDKRRVLPEPFDDEYFRHVQWAHLASGGAGGGMRWPNRRPHALTDGMHRAQHALSRFLPLIDWTQFQRRNVSAEIRTQDAGVATLGCSDGRQAVLWLVRRDGLGVDGMLRRDLAPRGVRVTLPRMAVGSYDVLA